MMKVDMSKPNLEERVLRAMVFRKLFFLPLQPSKQLLSILQDEEVDYDAKNSDTKQGKEYHHKHKFSDNE